MTASPAITMKASHLIYAWLAALRHSQALLVELHVREGLKETNRKILQPPNQPTLIWAWQNAETIDTDIRKKCVHLDQAVELERNVLVALDLHERVCAQRSAG